MPAITSLPHKVPFNGVEITVSPFHQTRHLFDVSRCFVFTELIPILESWCHMVMRSCPLRCGVSFTILQKQQRTPSITEIVTKVPRLQGVKTMKRFQITKETTRRPAGTASAAGGEEFHQKVSPERSGARRVVPPPALTGRLTGGEEPPGGRRPWCGTGAPLTIPILIMLPNYFCFLWK